MAYPYPNQQQGPYPNQQQPQFYPGGYPPPPGGLPPGSSVHYVTNQPPPMYGDPYGQPGSVQYVQQVPGGPPTQVVYQQPGPAKSDGICGQLCAGACCAALCCCCMECCQEIC